MESASEAFDASFGLQTAGCDVGDAELLESAAELCGLAATGELLFHRPVIVVANEDAVTISVETEGNAEAAEQALEQAKIAASVFGRKKFGDQDFAGRVIEKAEQGKLWAAIFEPAMKAGVEQDHFSFASAGQAALTMRESASLAGRADSGRAQQTVKGFTPEREAFLLDQFFAQVMVIEAGIGGPGQLQDTIPHALRQTARAGSFAAGVCQVPLHAR